MSPDFLPLPPTPYVYELGCFLAPRWATLELGPLSYWAAGLHGKVGCACPGLLERFQRELAAQAYRRRPALARLPPLPAQ